MCKVLVLSFFIFIISLSTQAQHLSGVGLSFPGVAYTGGQGFFKGGNGFELLFQHTLYKGRIRLGLEARSIDWGNQVGVNLGYNLAYFQKNGWRISGTTGFQVGAALFQNKSLMSWALEYAPELEWQSKKRFFSHLSIGFRYSNSPKYKDYGAINSVSEIPVKLGFGFHLRGKRAE